MRLADLNVGSKAVVKAVTGAGVVPSRLMEMGLVPGATVEVMRRAPLGDPVQYRICGASISMRCSEAACVDVETCMVAGCQGVTADEKNEVLILAAG